jgi:threonine/homoserine/homoserine lactone efflux protein
MLQLFTKSWSKRRKKGMKNIIGVVSMVIFAIGATLIGSDSAIPFVMIGVSFIGFAVTIYLNRKENRNDYL